MPDQRIVVVYGGRSAEHEVSCISARSVLAALGERYRVDVLGVTPDGTWVDVGPASELLAKTGEQGNDLAATGGPAAGASLPSPGIIGGAVVDPVRAVRGEGGPSVVFPVLHGPMGEDGTIQGLLEVAGVAYVGAGVLGSALAMDKAAAKAVLGAAGLPQVRYLHVRVDDLDDALADLVGTELGWPVFVKPANLGSTIGISRAADPAALAIAMELALAYDEHLVIEEAVVAREIELGVLGHPQLRVTGPGEPQTSREFYDYEDKYLAGTAGLAIPAQLPPGVADAARELARRACAALRVEGMARVDFFYEDPGRGLILNEVNTIPGFTAISMYPMLWAAEGLPPAELVDELLAAARSRHARRAGFRTVR